MGKQTGGVRTSEPSAEEKPSNRVTILQPDEAVRPGETTILYMDLYDDELTVPVKIQLQKNDLGGPFKQKIPSRNISIQPPMVLLQPGETKEAVIRINIPGDCKPGHYTSLFTDLKNPSVKAIINIEVI